MLQQHSPDPSSVTFIKPIDPLCLLNTFITPDIELSCRQMMETAEVLGGVCRRMTPNNWAQKVIQRSIFTP